MTKCKYCEDEHHCHGNDDQVRIEKLQALCDESNELSNHYHGVGTPAADNYAAFHDGAVHAYGRAIELLGGTP